MLDPLEEIRAIAARKKWKPGDLARLLGCGKVQVHNLMAGRTELKWRHIIAIYEGAGLKITNFETEKE